MEINLNMETLRKYGSIVLILLALAGGFYYLYETGTITRLFTNEPPAADAQASAVAAESGVEAFFTLDYEETAEGWLDRVCSQSTIAGCDYAEAFALPSVTMLLKNTELKTGCSAKAVQGIDQGVVTDGVAEDETVVYEWEVWQVHITLSEPWDGVDAEQNIYVYVTTEDGEWKFDHILFEQEVAKYEEATE